MNIQEAFDRAYQGVVNQGRPSMSYSACQYRLDDGIRCGVGHLLTSDEMCDRWDENTWTIYDLTKKPEELSRAKPDMVEAGIADLPLEFLADLQNAHDLASDAGFFLESFKAQMVDVAKKWNLNHEH